MATPVRSPSSAGEGHLEEGPAKPQMIHLGWFVGRGYSIHGWRQDWWGDDFRDWTSPDIYLDLARALDALASTM
jgi:hypothetical protein